MADKFESYFGYIEDLGGDGWLKVKFNDGLIWPLPEYLRVHVIKSDDREEFEILEGQFRGKKATVTKKGWRLNDWDESFFEGEAHARSGCPHKDPAALTFYRKSEKLEITGLGKFNAFTEPANPVPLGKHDLELPYEPHGLGLSYTSQATYAKTWFRVGHSGDRFLHCGSVSAGCITVKDIKEWDKIYRHLIISRSGLDNVGMVNILNQ